jgi:hypothetical protein
VERLSQEDTHRATIWKNFADRELMIQDWGVTYDDLEPSTRNSRRLAVEISGFAAGADQYQILGDAPINIRFSVIVSITRDKLRGPV